MVKVDYEVADLAALSEYPFLTDMHVHSNHSHDCATPVKQIITKARKLGIHVALTDHNQITGVLEAQRYKDAPIIPGIEICSKEGKEVLAYFTTAAALEDFFHRVLSHFSKETYSISGSRTFIPMKILLAGLAQYDCLVAIPHPFGPQPRRSYPYFNRKRHKDFLQDVHAIEVFNQQVTRKSNMSALGWAVHRKKGTLGGSDAHVLKHVGHGITASRATSIAEHLALIKEGDVHIVGKELRPHERVWSFAQSTVKNKLKNGVHDGIRKGISLSKLAFQQ